MFRGMLKLLAKGLGIGRGIGAGRITGYRGWVGRDGPMAGWVWLITIKADGEGSGLTTE